jgi:beta-glucanase (GH16 family)
MFPCFRRKRLRSPCRFVPALTALEERLVLSPPGSGWQLLWHDEFDGTALDTSKWTVDSGPRRDAMNTADAISVGGDFLTITTYTSGGTNYTGFIGTANALNATYGYWEARIAFQDSPATWSGFWLWTPTVLNANNNPAVDGTEIDIVEHRATDANGNDVSNTADNALFWNGYGPRGQQDHNFWNNPTNTPLQGNFHVYGLQWSPAGYQFYIDGIQVWSTTEAISHRSEYIYLTSEEQNNFWAGNVPAGGYGSLDTSQTKMTVDYVRVWQQPVAGLSDSATTEGTATPALPFSLTQMDGTTTSISALSSNPILVPSGNITLSGSNADWTLTAVPVAGQTGYAVITVNASNGIVSGSSSFTLTVDAGSFHNGGFEDDPAGTGWSFYGGAQVVGSEQRSGNRALSIINFGGASQVITGLQPNTSYTFDGYARVTNAGTSVRIGVLGYGDGSNQIYTMIASTNWTRGTVTFATGSSSTQAEVYCYNPTTTTANTGLFDDLSVFLTPTVPVWSAPVNLGPIINFSGSDTQDPAISSDGLSLYFSSNRPGGVSGGKDLWVSQRTRVNDPWGQPQDLGPAINDPSSTENLTPMLSPDQHWLFFSSDRAAGYGGLDIWASYRPDTQADFGWQASVNLGPGVNTQYDETGPDYFVDEVTGIPTLYFASDRPGDLGNSNIYASTLRGFEGFGPGVLVPEVSSTNSDTSTTIRSDRLEMFITSTSPGGLGDGLNIWVSMRPTTMDPWSTPANLGSPINMDGFDDGSPALSSDGIALYFYSNRPGGFGVNDLYMSTLLGGGAAPPGPERRLPGIDPRIIRVLGSFPGLEDPPIFGNAEVITAGPANSASPQQTCENQAGALVSAAYSFVSGPPQRQATDRFFAVRPGADPARELLEWGTTSELDLLAFHRRSDLCAAGGRNRRNR